MTDSQNIRDRAFVFACAVAKLALALPPRPGIRCVVDQLLKSATSVGANLEEAKAGSSTRDFIRITEMRCEKRAKHMTGCESAPPSSWVMSNT